MPELTVDQAFQLALQHHQAGRLDEAEPIYRKIIEVSPEHSDAIHLLGMTAFQRGKADVALELVRRAIELRPGVAIYHNNLGQTLERLGRTKEVAAEYRNALALNPNYPEAHNNLANVLEREDKMAEAIAGYRTAIRLNPDYAEAYTNLGNVFKEQGNLDEAIDNYRRAIQLKPGLSLLHSNLLLTLHYHTGYAPADLLMEHRRWAERHAAPLKVTHRPHSNSRDPDRRLRIGYVSPDFREHAVARFILPLLEKHDRAGFEVFAYADVRHPDAFTHRIKAQTDVWRDTTGADDAAVAEFVRRDGIDILVDLAAHTGGSRLLAFARKPAPLQVTYLAYCSTTGLDTIDYRFSDPFLDPEGTDLASYSETTIRLPDTYWCYPPPDAPLEINELPAGNSRGITFGCLNNFCKVTDATLQVWGRLLCALPQSRLLLHARGGSHRQRVLDSLHPCGIDASRVSFVGKQSFLPYLATYQQIDIGLDPFPFTGGTTTCDALWMGVPVISLAGRTAVSRGGSSLLSNIGLQELVAHTVEDYIGIAMQLAEDRGRLARLRSELRPRMQASPLMDASRFTDNVEAAFRACWQNWCKQPLP